MFPCELVRNSILEHQVPCVETRDGSGFHRVERVVLVEYLPCADDDGDGEPHISLFYPDRFI